MGATVITKVRLYRMDPLTRIHSLAYPVGATVPVEEYERLAGETAPAPASEPEPQAVPSATPAASPAPAAAPAPPAKANPTKAELKTRLEELGVTYAPKAKLDELAALVEAAEVEAAEKAKASEPPALAPSDE